MTEPPRKSAARLAPASKARERSSPPRPAAIARSRRILRLPAVRDKTGLSRSQVYRELGHMRIKLGPNTAGWIESEIENWLAERIAASRAGAAAAQ